MSFILDNFISLGSKLSSTINNIWLYRTEETSTDLLVSGYFNLVAQIISENDLVISSCNDGLFILKMDTEKSIVPVVIDIYGDENPGFLPVAAGQTLAVSDGKSYYCQGTGANIEFTLPADADVGTECLIINQLSGPSEIEVHKVVGQNIICGTSTTSAAAGFISCNRAGTKFYVLKVLTNTWFIKMIEACNDSSPQTAIVFH